MEKPFCCLVRLYNKGEEIMAYVSYLKVLIKIRIYLEVPCYLKTCRATVTKAQEHPHHLGNLEIQTRAPLPSYRVESSGGEAWHPAF